MVEPGSFGSILDRGPDGPRPIYIEPSSDDANSDIVLTLVTIVILTSFFVWLTYLLSRSVVDTQYRNSSAVTLCSPGQCALDNTTGEMICPPEGETTIAYNSATQSCTDPGVCTAIAFGYSILPDGSTDSFGNCYDGYRCRCSTNPRCSNNTSSIFKAIGGNPYVSIAGTATSFVQSAVTLPVGQVDGPSISAGQFCKIPIDWLYRSSPGCNNIPDNLEPIEKAVSCVSSNPCVRGVLAYVMDDSSKFTIDDITRLPLTCVEGTMCTSSVDNNKFNVPIYDQRYGGVVCRVIDISDS